MLNATLVYKSCSKKPSYYAKSAAKCRVPIFVYGIGKEVVKYLNFG